MSVSDFQFERHSKVRWKGARVLATRYWPMFVSKRESRKYYDAWLPTLSPSKKLLKQIQGDKITWAEFSRRYKKEMKREEAQHAINLLAGLSRKQPISVGCGCADKRRCHRSILSELITKAGMRR